MQLVIDTSTDIAGLAIMDKERMIVELTWRCGQNHTIELYPRLDFLLKEAHRDINEIDSVFVARGPGSFNGLRVGVSAAKGLALSLGIPVKGISTLESIAYQHAECGLPVCALIPAGREELAAGIYQKKVRKGWVQLAAEHLATIEALGAEIKVKTIFCGEYSPSTGEQIRKQFKSLAVIPGPAANIRRAAYLAELGRKYLSVGNPDDAAALQPIYLRRPPITERKKA